MQDTRTPADNLTSAQEATPNTQHRSYGDTVVRCSQGHLYTTIWIPLVSLKAIRLGSQRYQRCPVGKHWALTRPVPEEERTEEERQEAATHHDVRIP